MVLRYHAYPDVSRVIDSVTTENEAEGWVPHHSRVYRFSNNVNRVVQSTWRFRGDNPSGSGRWHREESFVEGDGRNYTLELDAPITTFQTFGGEEVVYGNSLRPGEVLIVEAGGTATRALKNGASNLSFRMSFAGVNVTATLPTALDSVWSWCGIITVSSTGASAGLEMGGRLLHNGAVATPVLNSGGTGNLTINQSIELSVAADNEATVTLRPITVYRCGPSELSD